MLLALSNLMEVPGYERDYGERGDDEEDEDENEECSAERRGSCIPSAERVVVVMMDFDRARLQRTISSWISWRVSFYQNSFAGLQVVSA